MHEIFATGKLLYKHSAARRIVFAAFLVILGPAAARAQDGGRNVEVKFEKGKTAAHFKDQVGMMNPAVYVVHVKKGQTLSFHLTNAEGILAQIKSPDSKNVEKIDLVDVEKADKTSAQVAGRSGTYRISVMYFGPSSPLYELEISVR
jgi:hypothetical protein